MKNTEIHTDLDKKDVRDLIAKGLVDCFFDKGPEAPSHSSLRHANPFRKQVIRCEFELKLAQHKLEVARRQEAYGTIMETLGWEEFDVSDETTDSYAKLAMSFIGTPAEYNNLMKQINNEE